MKIRWDLKDAEVETVAFAKVTLGMSAALKPDIIFDRSFLSIWAYRPEVRFMSPLIAALGQSKDVRVCILTVGEAGLRDRYREKPDQFFTQAEVVAADARFRELAEILSPRVATLSVDTGGQSLAECCKRIDRWLSVETPAPAHLADRSLTRTMIPVGEILVEVFQP